MKRQLFIGCCVSLSLYAQTLTIEMTHIRPITSSFIYLQICQEDLSFPHKCNHPIYQEKIPVTSSTQILNIPLKDGIYAVSAFHDVNNNGKLDTTIIGIPKEGYTFSGGKKTFPSFSNSSFELRGHHHLQLPFYY